MAGGFTFLDPGALRDGDLELLLSDRQRPPRPDFLPAYVFTLRWRGAAAGRISLRIGSTPFVEKYAGHLGYDVHPPFRGRRLAARACRLVLPLARRHDLDPLWITCNPDNLASRRTCEIAGAQLIEIVPLPPDCDMYAEGERSKCRYRLDLP